jgi:methionyl-tRNA formyltransferase
VVARNRHRIVFFGTPEFAVPTLDALLETGHNLVAVVTQPDKPRGRGQRTTDAPIKASATRAGLRVLQPSQLRDPDFVETLKALQPDLGVVAAYGKILTRTVLDVPRSGYLNVHASLLPRWRGAAPVQRAVIAGDRETGVTIMRMIEALDAGPMLASVRRPIAIDETSDAIERDLARLGAALLVHTIERLESDSLRDVAQDDSAATYAPRLTRDDGRIDWTASAVRVHNLIRGLHPWPHAFTFLARDRFILHRSTVTSGAVDAPGGTVLASSGRLQIAAGAGAIDVLDLQIEGGRILPARAFLAGHHVAPGSRFTPFASAPP